MIDAHKARICVVPWNTLMVDIDRQVQICCLAIRGKNDFGSSSLTLNEIANHPNRLRIQQQMLDHQWPSDCSFCQTLEESGCFSQRLNENQRYPDTLSEIIKRNSSYFKIEHFDFRSDSLCNLKCRTCGPYNSMRWIPDFKKIYSDYDDKRIEKDFEFERFLSDDLKTVYLAGGEPLLGHLNQKLINMLIDSKKSKNLNLIINTNLAINTQTINRFLDLFCFFKAVTLTVSFDGIFKQGEYIRSGLHFKRFCANMGTVLKHPFKFDVELFMTLGVLNIFHLPDIFRFLRKVKWSERTSVALNLISRPEYYNIQYLPYEIKEAVRIFYLKHLSQLSQKENDQLRMSEMSFYKQILSYMVAHRADSRFLEFIQMTKKLDEIRSESFVQLFPEMIPYFEKFNEKENDTQNNKKKLEVDENLVILKNYWEARHFVTLGKVQYQQAIKFNHSFRYTENPKNQFRAWEENLEKGQRVSLIDAADGPFCRFLNRKETFHFHEKRWSNRTKKNKWLLFNIISDENLLKQEFPSLCIEKFERLPWLSSFLEISPEQYPLLAFFDRSTSFLNRWLSLYIHVVISKC